MKIVIDIPEDMYNDANILMVKDLPELRKIIANGKPYEERPQGGWIPIKDELNMKYLARFADKTPSYETVKQLGFAGSYEDYLKTILGTDSKRKAGMIICENCIHKEVCGLEGYYDEALKFCADKMTESFGKWVDDNEGDSYYANCSCCGYQIDTHYERGYLNFCPNCGADMRGGKEE